MSFLETGIINHLTLLFRSSQLVNEQISTLHSYNMLYLIGCAIFLKKIKSVHLYSLCTVVQSLKVLVLQRFRQVGQLDSLVGQLFIIIFIHLYSLLPTYFFIILHIYCPKCTKCIEVLKIKAFKGVQFL